MAKVTLPVGKWHWAMVYLLCLEWQLHISTQAERKLVTQDYSGEYYKRRFRSLQ